LTCRGCRTIADKRMHKMHREYKNVEKRRDGGCSIASDAWVKKEVRCNN
jgi:hypothetical protein